MCRPLRLLIVDDHSFIRDALTSILTRSGQFTLVGEARDGLEALRLVDELTPQVVLMDVRMPRMDGPTATKVICEKYPETAVVLMSAQEEGPDLAVIEGGRKVRFLSKGEISPERLARIVGMEPTAPPQA